jgi:hypothetical protein
MRDVTDFRTCAIMIAAGEDFCTNSHRRCLIGFVAILALLVITA